MKSSHGSKSKTLHRANDVAEGSGLPHFNFESVINSERGLKRDSLLSAPLPCETGMREGFPPLLVGLGWPPQRYSPVCGLVFYR